MVIMASNLLASLALVFGAWMGARSLIQPEWGSKVVGLSVTPGKPEGKSEFRGTLGGMFLLGHLVTLIGLWRFDAMVAPLIVIPLAAGWFGAAFGRTVSIFLDDGTRTRLNWIWVALELGMAIAIAAPLIAFARLF